MAGHSRWAQVRHRKAGTDARRGVQFSKLSRMISVAAREGGADPETNFKLRQVIEQARSAGLPKDTIERAIQRATASPEAENLRAVEYEAYGPGGSALLISGLTDNPNRTTSEIKKVLAEAGGRLAEAGSVAWMFARKVLVEYPLPATEAEATELALIDAGAEDTATADGEIQAVVSPERFDAFRKAAEATGLVASRTALVAIPKNPIRADAANVRAIETLLTALEDHPDVTEVWTNLADSE